MRSVWGRKLSARGDGFGAQGFAITVEAVCEVVDRYWGDGWVRLVVPLYWDMEKSVGTAHLLIRCDFHGPFDPAA